MNSQIPYERALATANNIGAGLRQGKDQTAIDQVLSDALASNDPKVFESSIAKILSQVSPQNQKGAIEFLTQRSEKINKEMEKGNSIEAGKRGGYDPYAPAGVQTQQVRDNNKKERLNSLYGNNQSSNEPANMPVSQLNDRDKLINLSGHPDKEISEPAKARLKELQKSETENRADQRESRKEVAPLKKEIIERANIARTSINNKQHLLEVIDRGNLDDPSFAIIAQLFPFDFGKRILSNDTVEYKGALVDEYNDMKNVFKGATRVKEVEIYEDKLADLYLTDEQKKVVLKSRIKTLQVDIIREEAAEEVEQKHPNLSALQFNKKVDEVAKSKMNDLFNYTWNEQKAVIDQAENRKNTPLDKNDPDDLQIMIQIKKEANGDPKKALEIAKKKGYKFK